jgi:hypothetical protein
MTYVRRQPYRRSAECSPPHAHPDAPRAPDGSMPSVRVTGWMGSRQLRCRLPGTWAWAICGPRLRAAPSAPFAGRPNRGARRDRRRRQAPSDPSPQKPARTSGRDNLRARWMPASPEVHRELHASSGWPAASDRRLHARRRRERSPSTLEHPKVPGHFIWRLHPHPQCTSCAHMSTNASRGNPAHE